MIDIIFDGRNKEYGAYELRSKYEKRISRALLTTAILVGLAIGGTVLANSFKKPQSSYVISRCYNFMPIQDEKPVEKIPEPEKTKPQEQQIKTQKFTEFKPVEDEEFQTPPPAQVDFDDSKIGLETKTGIINNGVLDEPDSPDNLSNGSGVIEPPKEKPEEIVEIVEIDAKFSGNWKQFLEKNLNPDVPVQNNAPEGRYSVVIRFVVDKEGIVSDITPLTNHGYGMEQETVRVLRKASKWEPAIQNGLKVKAYRKQVIVFEVLNDN